MQNINLRRSPITKRRNRHLTRQHHAKGNRSPHRKTMPTIVNTRTDRLNIPTRTIRRSSVQNALIRRSARSIIVNVTIVSRRHTVNATNRISVPSRKLLLNTITVQTHTRMIRTHLTRNSSTQIISRHLSLHRNNIRPNQTITNSRAHHLIQIRNSHNSSHLLRIDHLRHPP